MLTMPNQLAVNISKTSFNLINRSDVPKNEWANVAYLKIKNDAIKFISPAYSLDTRGLLKLSIGYNSGNFTGVSIYGIYTQDVRAIGFISNGFALDATRSLSVVPIAQDTIKITLLSPEYYISVGATFETVASTSEDLHASIYLERTEYVENIQPDGINILNMRPGYRYYGGFGRPMVESPLWEEKKPKDNHPILALKSSPKFKFKHYKSKLVA